MRKNCGKSFALLIALVPTCLDDPTAFAQGFRPNVDARRIPQGVADFAHAGKDSAAAETPRVEGPVLIPLERCHLAGQPETAQ